MKKRLILLAALAACIALFLIATNERLIVRRYKVASGQVDAPVRLAHMSDLHGDDYGPGGAQLLELLNQEQPHAILLTGDMFSPDNDTQYELALFGALAEIAPTFYVTGNHEAKYETLPALLQDIQAAGVQVLDQSCISLTLNGQPVNICGVPDPASGTDMADALARTAEQVPPEGFTVLLSHRPEMIDLYAAHPVFDLALCGHAHGGQARIPFLVNGLYAPNQGAFPPYAGGRYDKNALTMIVSRGMVYSLPENLPRVFNRPELVIVTIE